MTIRRCVPLAFASVTAMFALAAQANADPNTDTKYLQALDKMGVWYDTPANAISMGHGVCAALASDIPVSKILRAATSSGYTYGQAGSILGVATGAYCPQYYDKEMAQQKQIVADAGG